MMISKLRRPTPIWSKPSTSSAALSTEPPFSRSDKIKTTTLITNLQLGGTWMFSRSLLTHRSQPPFLDTYKNRWKRLLSKKYLKLFRFKSRKAGCNQTKIHSSTLTMFWTTCKWANLLDNTPHKAICILVIYNKIATEINRMDSQLPHPSQTNKECPDCNWITILVKVYLTIHQNLEVYRIGIRATFSWMSRLSCPIDSLILNGEIWIVRLTFMWGP